MAKDAGISAIVVFGCIFAAVNSIKAFRREIESGTAALALSHAVSREGFFIAKTLGVMLALFAFVSALVANSIVIVNGAAIGGKLAASSGDIARLYGPSFLIGVAIFLLPSIIAAALNRFARFRFCLTAFILTLVASLISMAFRFDLKLVMQVSAMDFLSSIPTFVLAAAASAFAARFRHNVAGLCTVAAAMLLCPIMINYTRATSPGTALIAALSLIAALIVGGSALFKERDLI